MGIFSASYSGQLLPTVASWRMTDIVRNTPTVPEAMERLAAQELIPVSWVRGQMEVADARRLFYPSLDEALKNSVPSVLPSSELLELLASRPHRIEEAERLIQCGLSAFGTTYKVAWVSLPPRSCPPESAYWSAFAPFQSLKNLNVRALSPFKVNQDGRTENYFLVGLPQADEKLQKACEVALVRSLFDPEIPIGFGNIGEFPAEEAVRKLLDQNPPAIIGAMETYVDCLEEVVRTQKVLAGKFRETSSDVDYLRWLADRGIRCGKR